MPSFSEILATLPPEHRGIIEAAELNLTTPCTVVWCDHQCRWAADIVGGAVARLHGRDFPGGTQLSQIEHAPGAPVTEDDDTSICLHLTQEHSDRGLIHTEEVSSLIAELVQALQVMSSTRAPLANWAPPAWVTEHNLDAGGCMSKEHQVEAALAAYDGAAR